MCHQTLPMPNVTRTRTQCQHCHRANVNRPRGLCWGCYYTPGVKDQYPSTSKFARRGVGNISGTSLRPGQPTMALPGSPEKIAILAERARLHQELWHPEDCVIPAIPLALAHAG